MSTLAPQTSVIKTRFDERKTAAAAGKFLELSGGSMKYLRLIKLLYLADRESWRELNRPITGDQYFAMKFGPVLSRTFDLIRHTPESGPWARLIETDPAEYEVRLKREAKVDLGPLSQAEIHILKRAHVLHARMDQWKLCDLTHLFKEWRDPGDLSSRILPEKILDAVEKSEEEIDEVREESAERAYFDHLLGA